MTLESPSPHVLARYAPRYSGGPFWPIAGLAILGIMVYNMIGRSGEERLVSIVFLVILAAGIGIVGVIMALVGLRAIEVLASGTIDFVSRIKRDSFPRADLARVEGRTTSSRQSRTHWMQFIFRGADQKKIEKNVVLPRKDDPALQEFVRQLERLNPRLDASQFWAWSQGAEEK